MSALIARVETADMIITHFFIAAELAGNIQIDSVLSLVIAIARGPFATCLELFFEKKREFALNGFVFSGISDISTK